MLKKGFSVFMTLIFALLFLWTNSNAESPKEITVSAAISLKNAFEEIGKIFQKRHKGVKVLLNFGASGDLQQQIEAGAPIDVFASASAKEMDELDRKNLIIKDTRVNFAGNVVVLISPSNSRLPLRSFNDLQKKEVKRIAIGNPMTVPVGMYSEEILIHFNLWDVLKNKFILAENVRQVLDYVARDEVDAGIVYSTDARVRPKEVKVVMQAPEGSHRPMVYPIAVIKGTKNEMPAREFISTVVSKEGEKVLQRYGFKLIRQAE